jgi:hypothetical protein
MAHDVFISHSSEDRPAAEAVLAALEGAGLACWIAPRDIVPGQDYGEAIIDGIRSSRVFLLVLSRSSVDSHQVRRETERAASAGRFIIPFRIEDVQPSKSLEYFISSAQWLDAFPPPLDRHLDYLVQVVRHRLGEPETNEAPAASQTVALAERPPRRRSRFVPIAVVLAVAAAAVIAVVLFWRPSTARTCTAVPDTAQTGFVQRATPLRSDKPLWLRSGPSPRARPITRIGPDEVFRVIPESGRVWWSARLCDGTTGFVASRFITLVAPPASAQQAPPR